MVESFTWRKNKEKTRAFFSHGYFLQPENVPTPHNLNIGSYLPVTVIKASYRIITKFL